MGKNKNAYSIPTTNICISHINKNCRSPCLLRSRRQRRSLKPSPEETGRHRSQTRGHRDGTPGAMHTGRSRGPPAAPRPQPPPPASSCPPPALPPPPKPPPVPGAALPPAGGSALPLPSPGSIPASATPPSPQSWGSRACPPPPARTGRRPPLLTALSCARAKHRSPRNTSEEQAGGCSFHPPLLRSAPAGGGRRGTTLPSMPRGGLPPPPAHGRPQRSGTRAAPPGRTLLGRSAPRPHRALREPPRRRGPAITWEERGACPGAGGAGRGTRSFCAQAERGRGAWGLGGGVERWVKGDGGEGERDARAWRRRAVAMAAVRGGRGFTWARPRARPPRRAGGSLPAREGRPGAGSGSAVWVRRPGCAANSPRARGGKGRGFPAGWKQRKSPLRLRGVVGVFCVPPGLALSSECGARPLPRQLWEPLGERKCTAVLDRRTGGGWIWPLLRGFVAST